MASWSITTVPASFQRIAQGGWVARIGCGIGLFLLLIGAGDSLWWRGQMAQQELGRVQERILRQQFQSQSVQANRLTALGAQKSRLEQEVLELEQALPSKLEIAALLSDVNQAGVARGLQFASLKPGPEVLSEWYAELPLEIKLSGSYHAIAAFAADLAQLPHCVTLAHLSLVAGKEGATLSLDAVAKTLRRLDLDEAAMQRLAHAKASKK